MILVPRLGQDSRPAVAELLKEAPNFGEHYLFYPDFETAPSGMKHGSAGDRRGAMAPFIANQYLKSIGVTYNWMLVGDDNTLFWMAGTRRLLSQFNPDQPLFISDAISGPGPRLTCPACGFKDPALGPPSCDSEEDHAN
eukprot:gene14980-21038_t